MTRHPPDGRPHEELEGHHRAHRVAGQADPRDPAEQPEADRRARAHPQLPESLHGAELIEHRADVVVLAHADTGRGDEQVAVERAPEVLAQALGRVPGDTEIDWFAAGPADQRHERMGVAARDLPPAQDFLGLVDVHDLVAAAEDGHPRTAVDQWVGHGEGGEHA